MVAILCLDFDDTIVTENVTREILREFAAPGWEALEDAYHRGESSVEQYNAAALDLVPPDVEREVIEAFARQSGVVRPGFDRLVDWAHWNDWQVAVVSNGFDLGVDAVLGPLGFDRLGRHCGRTHRGYRWRVRYLTPRGIEVSEGFKLSYVNAFLAAGDFVAYTGDGASDVEPARRAHAVFARDTLLEELNGGHARLYPFATFDDVVGILDREAEAWLASFSSTTAAAD